MRRAHPTRIGSRLRSDSGQTIVFVLLVLGIFLLAVVALGVDFANMWFHRQAAQNAADAACTAGAMDMLANANTGGTRGGFTTGTDFDCATLPTAVPCKYAALNGYNGANTAPGNQVSVTFPATSSVPGIDPGSIPGGVSNAMRVDVIEHVQTFFSGLLTGNSTVDVHVRATCAVLKAQSPIPLIVLKPDCADTFKIPGNGNVAIIGGPNRSIQTNSDNVLGVNVSGSATVDLSKGGPNFTGSQMAVFGGPSTAPAGFNGGTTGGWSYPVSPIADPYAQVAAPTQPAAAQAPASVGLGVDGCPDDKGCTEYFPGLYVTPIVVKNGTAILNPGLYYFNIPAAVMLLLGQSNCGESGGCIAKPTGQCNYALIVGPNGIVRPGTNTTCPQCDSSGGITFYLSGPGGANGYGSVFFGANAGNPQGGHIVTDFNTAGITCPGGTAPDPSLGLPGTVPGNVLFGPCTQDGTYFSSPTNASTTGPVRGMLFFDDRANGDNHSQPSMQGGGGLLLAGTMYFHHCPNSLTTGCDPVTDYRAFLQFQGNSGSGTFLLGNITTDELITGGGGKVSMQLDSARVFTILKATLVQ